MPEEAAPSPTVGFRVIIEDLVPSPEVTRSLVDTILDFCVIFSDDDDDDVISKLFFFACGCKRCKSSTGILLILVL